VLGPTVSKTGAAKALRMVLEKIEADGIPNLVMKMEKRAANRFVNIVKASRLLVKLPEDVRESVKTMLSSDI
jgi:hypothetical protein